MTEENFFDMFNRIHNPDYYYGKQKTQKKKTETKKTDRKRHTAKRHPVFKVQDWVDRYYIWFWLGDWQGIS